MSIEERLKNCGLSTVIAWAWKTTSTEALHDAIRPLDIINDILLDGMKVGR